MSNLIYITSGIGQGLTEISAFDAALYDAGIANYNLIYLSSIIPNGWEPVVKKFDGNDIEYGYKLYVVLSKCEVSEAGRDAWAGLGWVTSSNSLKHGFFVEHSGSSKQEVRVAIKNSVTSMSAYRPGINPGALKEHIVGAICKDIPLCVLVAAVYRSEVWS